MSKQHQELFFGKLKDVFIGEKVEGTSGFVNLMRIKSDYFDAIFNELKTEIEARTNEFPDFREEMYEKLYTFFKTYFSESGSIYFRYTPLKSNVYEKVYSNQEDVSLFWKTYMLYYVKTDKLWNSLSIRVTIEDDEYTIIFDVSRILNKADSQKRDLIYSLEGVEKDQITFKVEYSWGARNTDIDRIVHELQSEGIQTDEDELVGFLRIFEKQNEVDYFISKNARMFLRDQLSLWLKNYLLEDESDFSEQRLRKIKALKDVASRVIEFVAQFEDELVKIWNKPKFVLDSDYIVTFDRIASKREGEEVIKAIIDHGGFGAQKDEWRDLGILSSFNNDKLFASSLTGKILNPEYQHLPIDTKHFDRRIKQMILSLFVDMDKELEGWLIHSENYQALKTILPKLEGRVKTIYIDPPYNTDASAILYKNNYKDSSWLTLLENRLQLAHSLLTTDGVICVAVDDEEFAQLKLMARQIFDKQVGIVVVRSNPAGRKTKGKFAPAHEYAIFYGKSESSVPGTLEKSAKSFARYPKQDDKGRFAWQNFIRSGSHDKRTDRPKLYYPIYVDDKNNLRIPKMTWVKANREYSILEKPKSNETVVFPITEEDGIRIEKNWQRGHLRVENEPDEFRVRRSADGSISIDFKTRMDIGSLPVTWWDDKRYASANYGAAELKNLFGKKVFDFSKSLRLVEDCLKASNANGNSTVLDFFSGSGTTAHAVMAMNAEDKGQRKFILIEMAEYFETVIVPRLKKVAYSLNWDGGKAKDGDGPGVFCKYYDLEQYETTLKKSVYKGSSPFVSFEDKSIFEQYVFMKDKKLLDAIETSLEHEKVSIDLAKIYPDADISETLSNLKGKAIRQAGKDWVEFIDGERLDFGRLDFDLVRPLIWW